jgi:hypothetical protein
MRGYNIVMVFLSLLAVVVLGQQGASVPKQDYEALVTGLTQEHTWLNLNDIGSGDPTGKLKPVMKLVDSGFEAVPSLLAHTHDARLTAARVAAGGASYTVGDFCTAMLLSLQQGGKVDVPPGYAAANNLDNDLQAWWQKAKRMGEQDYAYRTVIAAKLTPNRVLVRLLQLHYPFLLPAADEALAVREPGADTVQLLVAMSHAKLTTQTMIRICLRNALGTDPASVIQALRELAVVDQGRFDAKMIELLDKFSTPLAYVSGIHFGGDLASLMTLTTSPSVWASFSKAVGKAKTGDRWLMTASIRYKNPPSATRKLVRAFLVGRFKDSGKPPGKKPINDVAASEVGLMSHMIAPPESAPVAKWDAYRRALAGRG